MTVLKKEHQKQLVQDFIDNTKSTSSSRSSSVESVESRRFFLMGSFNSRPSLTAVDYAGTEGQPLNESIKDENWSIEKWLLEYLIV